MKLAIAAASALLRAGCATATEGTVTSKQHTPQHEEFSYFMCTAYYSNGSCMMQIPMYETKPECYGVNFHNDADDTEGSACVEPAEYDHYKLGDHYPRSR